MSWSSRNPKGKEVHDAGVPNGKQLSHDLGVAHITLDSMAVAAAAAQDNGEWEVIGKKSKNRGGSSAAKQNPLSQGLQNSNFNKAWSPAHQNSQIATSQKPAGRRNAWQQQQQPPLPNSNSRGGFRNNFVTPQHGIPPPLDQGWNWKSRAGAGNKTNNVAAVVIADNNNNSDSTSDSDEYDDGDDDDEFDSDSSEKSIKTLKQSRWFKKFFELLDGLRDDELRNPDREWHCPACKGGPGAIDWYQGLVPLMRHAETKKSKRVKLHRELARLLDHELSGRRVGTASAAPGELLGRWVGLKDEEKDYKIVWPPMVIIMNTRLEKDENEKWIGMGTEELFTLFQSYSPMKARHSYGPQGHCGTSILIFEASAMGYFEAERLHKNFTLQGLGREAWDHSPILFRPGGIRQLYGYMAVRRDLDVFNQHTEEKSKLKYEMKYYREMVVDPMREMSRESQQVIWLKDKLPKEQRLRKDAEETNGILRGKLDKVQEENRILKQRIKMQLEENKEEMDVQEEFYKHVISRARD